MKWNKSTPLQVKQNTLNALRFTFHNFIATELAAKEKYSRTFSNTTINKAKEMQFEP